MSGFLEQAKQVVAQNYRKLGGLLANGADQKVSLAWHAQGDLDRQPSAHRVRYEQDLPNREPYSRAETGVSTGSKPFTYTYSQASSLDMREVLEASSAYVPACIPREGHLHFLRATPEVQRQLIREAKKPEHVTIGYKPFVQSQTKGRGGEVKCFCQEMGTCPLCPQQDILRQFPNFNGGVFQLFPSDQGWFEHKKVTESLYDYSKEKGLLPKLVLVDLPPTHLETGKKKQTSFRAPPAQPKKEEQPKKQEQPQKEEELKTEEQEESQGQDDHRLISELTTADTAQQS
ncbi:hypothetical protein GNI_029670 [Gregarina niphandrodes]|uniref:Uncharacterized protein n=1 Tax=Gregarina niphandrodes TaxID=110365 RepID=A0A023BB17_GRENI|nr:hypothetical protein GNI_029670 [Gregarina niphandrodes]EZG79053.1 hypothetical protein GNI_029670 [Gregarina niphandrodes]|eukprot:XP_011129137.1 hypothetical protein GNI_029670 [Gregarina niphandrodes]